MRKSTLYGYALAAALGLAIAIPVSAAEAAGPKFCENGRGHPEHGMAWCADEGFAPLYVRHDGRQRQRDRRYGHDRAWHVVRNDPCLLHEYREFADRHKNPNKRARFLHRLAREGCPDPRFYDRRHHDHDRPSWFFFFGG